MKMILKDGTEIDIDSIILNYGSNDGSSDELSYTITAPLSTNPTAQINRIVSTFTPVNLSAVKVVEESGEDATDFEFSKLSKISMKMMNGAKNVNIVVS